MNKQDIRKSFELKPTDECFGPDFHFLWEVIDKCILLEESIKIPPEQFLWKYIQYTGDEAGGLLLESIIQKVGAIKKRIKNSQGAESKKLQILRKSS